MFSQSRPENPKFIGKKNFKELMFDLFLQHILYKLKKNSLQSSAISHSAFWKFEYSFFFIFLLLFNESYIYNSKILLFSSKSCFSHMYMF